MPEPESYLLAAKKLGVRPEECVTVEDSLNGIQAAISAGMNVVAFATPFTTKAIHSKHVVDHNWVVHTPEKLVEVVEARIKEHNKTRQT